jgi:hypothetical protein
MNDFKLAVEQLGRSSRYYMLFAGFIAVQNRSIYRFINIKGCLFLACEMVTGAGVLKKLSLAGLA